MDFTVAVRDFRRISYVVNILVKNGLGYFVQEFNLKYHLPFIKRFQSYPEPEAPQARLRKVMEHLGGAYIKLGQLLSLRPDLVPTEYCLEFSKLQDRVPSFPYAEVKAIVEKELNMPLHKVFSYFEKVPIGSASIGQVHAAKLINGRKVVVKVQRPGVEKQFLSDIDIMYYFAHKLEKSRKLKKYSPLRIVQEFERYTRNELNYITEGRNIERFYENFKGSKTIVIPKVYRAYSTKRVLTMEYLEGSKLIDLLRAKSRFDRRKAAMNLLDCNIKQIFSQDIFHADLHPGNIIMMSRGRLGLLDFGIAGSLSPEMRDEGLKLVEALVAKDVDKVTKQILKIGKKNDDVDARAFRERVYNIVMRWHGAELKQVRVTHMLHEIFDACADSGIELPVDMILLGKALITVEGTGMQLVPNLDFVNVMKPRIEKMLARKIRPSFKATLKKTKSMAEAIGKIPESALETLEQLKRPTFKIDIDDLDVRKIGLDIDTSSNRMSYAMISAALIVAGAVIMHANIGPAVFGYSMFAIVCFVFAFILLAVLVTSISKEKRTV